MRSIHSRVAKLEVVHAATLNSCATCGYPRRAALELVITRHCDPLPTCAGCSQPQDEEGTPLVTSYKRVVLDRPDLI